MADPARYHIDLTNGPAGYDILVERGSSGKWIKWLDFVDYKSAQKRNKNLETVERLGLEVVELRVRIQDLEKEILDMKMKGFKDRGGAK